MANTVTQSVDAQMKAARVLSHSKDLMIIHPEDLRQLLRDAVELGVERGRELANKSKPLLSNADKATRPIKSSGEDFSATEHDW